MLGEAILMDVCSFLIGRGRCRSDGGSEKAKTGYFFYFKLNKTITKVKQ